MLSELIIPQLTDKFWTPRVNYTIVVHNDTSTSFRGAVDAYPTLDPNGYLTEMYNDVWIVNGSLKPTSMIDPYVWIHEFTHVLQFGVHGSMPVWMLEAQANLMPNLVSGPDGGSVDYNRSVDAWYDKRQRLEYSIHLFPDFSASRPEDGIWAYLNDEKYGGGYDLDEGWARLYVYDNRILKNLNDRLFDLPYDVVAKESDVRSMLIDLIGNHATLGNVDMKTWLDAYGFCDVRTVARNRPYFSWNLAYQNEYDTGVVWVSPFFTLLDDNQIVASDIQYDLKLFDAFSGALLRNVSRTVFGNGSSFEECAIPLVPSSFGNFSVVVARVVARTSDGKTFESANVIFDSSGKITVGRLPNGRWDFGEVYDKPIEINVVVKDSQSLLHIQGTLTIQGQNVSQESPLNGQLLTLGADFVDSNMVLNVSISGNTTNCTATNLIVLSKADNIILTSQSIDNTAHVPGDLNWDGKVSLTDLVIFAQAYGSKPGETNWNANADIDSDGTVGWSDLVQLTQHYGQHYP
jgi:hypothetical protein